MRKNVKKLKSTRSEEGDRKKPLNLKSQAASWIEQIVDKELSNQKKQTPPKPRKIGNKITPLKLSFYDEDEVQVGDFSFCLPNAENAEFSFCCNVKLDTKLKCRGCNSTICYCSDLKDSMCHCSYCEGITTIDGPNYCNKKLNR